jgi:TRAP-type C4-dicarboxylate transport system substrate-binding protein
MKSVMTKKGLTVLAGIILLIGSLYTPGQGQAETVWKFQSLLNPGHMTVDTEIWVSKELEKRSNGDFKMDVFTGGSLGFAGPRNLTTVGQGILEACEIWGPHVAGDYRLMEIIALHGLIPFDVPLRKKIVEAVLPYQKKTLKDRFNVEVVWEVQVDPRNIYTKNPVKRLADFKGMKIRSEGIVENAVTKMLGATPVAMGWGEIYTGLQQGVIDGYWVTHTGTYNARFYEHAKYCYEMNIGGTPTFFIANSDDYNKLSPDHQKLLMELGKEGRDMMNDRVVSDVAKFKKMLQDAGMTFNPPHPDDAAYIKMNTPKIWDLWLENAEPEAKEIVQMIQAMVADWEKRNE